MFDDVLFHRAEYTKKFGIALQWTGAFNSRFSTGVCWDVTLRYRH